MTDEIINSSKEDIVKSANTLVKTSTPTCTDGKTVNQCDNDFQSDIESEKPILLELGNSSNLRLGAALYPLDMHLSNTALYMNTHAPPTYLNNVNAQNVASSLLTTHLGMYGNPFDVRNAFPPHIPHTVCTWPASDVGPKVSAEIVAPPLYASYLGTREFSIAKETNPSWKEKALQIEKDYKKTACDRERTRMRDMNKAFDLLRSKLPISKPNGKKYSKIESLRIAINYIHHLQECLKVDSPERVQFPADSKTGVRGTSADYLLDSPNHRQTQVYQFVGEVNRSFDHNGNDQVKSHNGDWSENNYIQNSQEKWD